MVITGGGAKSPLLRQIVSDVCELELTVLRQSEGAAFGAALQALWILLKESNPELRLALITSEHFTKDLSASTAPNYKNCSAYRDGYQRYLEAVELVTDL